MSETGETVSATRVDELEKTPQGIVRRWLAELNIAHREEEDWRTEGKKLWEMYEGGKKKAHAFNILWANTELLLPAVYNSTPEPDVRRRFRDADPVGKAVAELLERSLSSQVDEYDFDAEAESFVLDMLLVGRGVPRVKYKPRFAPQAVGPVAEGAEAPAPAEKLTGETVECESVQWDDFRRGPGKTWREVPWVAFRHDLTEEMAAEQFGEEIAAKLTYSDGKDADKISEDRQTREVFKTVEAWEFWDRDRKRVLFIAPSYADAPLLEAEDPLHLRDFFCCPRPAYAMKNTRTLVPVPIYRMYEEQAKELDKVSARINKIVDAMRVRGAYSANLPELSNILESEDRAMTPVQNVSEIASVGGLDKAIWMMPIDKLKQVLDGLYMAREQIKAAIYELTGLSDLVRGSTDAGETAAAQQLKSKWGSMRLQRLQREAQRTIRDVLRLKSEIIAERFSPETLEATTNLDFPTMEEKQGAQMQVQQAMQQSQMTGQPPPPMPPEMEAMMQKPSWEELMQVLRSDQLRQYRVDVETDSTVSETLDRDMAGLNEVLTALGAVMASVQTGTPPEVAKEAALAITRRARLGGALEDAIENFNGANAMQDIKQQFATEVTGMIKQESAKGAQDIKAQEQQQQSLQQYDQQIQGALQQVGQVAQGAEQGLVQIAQQQQQIIQQLQQALVALQQVPAMQTTEGVVNTLEGVREGFQAVIEAVQAPKSVAFDMDSNGVPRGAKVTPSASPRLEQAGAGVAAPTVQAVTALAQQQMQGFQQLAEVFTSGMQAVIQAVNTPKKVKLVRGADGRVAGAEASVQ
jgi:hypothetical protein